MSKVKTSNLDDYTREQAYAISETVGLAWDGRQELLRQERIQAREQKIKDAIAARKAKKEQEEEEE